MFGEFCPCCCLPLLPQLLATWGPLFRPALYYTVCPPFPADDGDIDSAEFTTVRVPVTDRSLQGILHVVPLQLLSYHMGVRLGKSIDNPRPNVIRAAGGNQVASS